jgi:asparagine synthase (glutamine-hydrolysing)
MYTRDFANHVGPVTLIAEELFAQVQRADRVNQMLYVDTKTWLPDELLLKADKVTMANSVELRVPFLDHKVLEFAASLPGRYKVHGRQTKYLLKKVLAGRVPAEIIKRKKAGFPVPYAKWLQSDLRDWVADLLLDRRATERGYFEKHAVERLIDQKGHSRNQSKILFTLVALELWHREFVDGSTGLGPNGRPKAVTAL